MFIRATSVIVLFVAAIHGQSTLNYTIPAERCVSPDGYNSCLAPVEAQAQDCITKAGTDQNQVAACTNTATLFNLNCVFENCWNIVGPPVPMRQQAADVPQVYSCDVQEVASLVAQNEGSGLPYYPAPDNAPGQCSCNLEAAQIVIGSSLGGAFLNCQNNSSNLDGCTCCAQAGAYTGLYSLCPSVDPQAILKTLPGIDILLTTYTPQFADCGSILQQNNCQNDLGYPSLGSLSYLSSLPASTGTASYSDLSGTVSAPSSSILTYTPTLLSVALTATAVSAGDGGGATPAASTSSEAARGASSMGPASSEAAGSGGSGGQAATTAAGSEAQGSMGSMTASASASSTSKSAGARDGPFVAVMGIFAFVTAVWSVR